jgi:hypothetical protein
MNRRGQMAARFFFGAGVPVSLAKMLLGFRINSLQVAAFWQLSGISKQCSPWLGLV